jgi:ferric iron reductase protein FhuF
VAAAYPAIAKLGSATRAGLVTDMWRQAVARGRAVERESCCFLYVMPGCHECAGCPRLKR